MMSFNNLKLRTKFVAIFVFMVFLTGLVLYLSIRTSIGIISTEAIPALTSLSQVGQGGDPGAAEQAVAAAISHWLAEINRNFILAFVGILTLAGLLGRTMTNALVKPIYQLVEAARQIEAGDFSMQVRVNSRDEIGELADSFNKTTSELGRRIKTEQQAREEASQARQTAEATNVVLEARIWQATGLARLNDKMQGEQDIPKLAHNIIQQLCHYLPAQIGAIYLADDQQLTLVGYYAYHGQAPTGRFKFGEGLVGQAALEKSPLVLSNIPPNYITIRSGFGQALPHQLLLYPFIDEDEVLGVIELGTVAEFSQVQQDFIQSALFGIAIAFNTALTRTHIHELLARLQRQAEELQTQEEELRTANEELEAQTESLRVSETKLREKQTELEATNVELEEKAAALEKSTLALKEKQTALNKQNRALKVAQQELQEQMEELTQANKYKSEFLANMSHELRTPLNSLLILARLLAGNEEGNLNEEQIEFAEIIHGAGTDLLSLINDILDLAKVEAGSLLFDFKPMNLADLTAAMRALFSHIADEKGLDFKITLAEDLPDSIETDEQRVKQIVRNLLSNAFKFTAAGSVTLQIYQPQASANLKRLGLTPDQAIAIEVVDTGIGIRPEQQKLIFEAFQQGDTGINRQYGGTGLGLTISRELAANLGGQISLHSLPDQGSTFTLYLPIENQTVEAARIESLDEPDYTPEAVAEPKPESRPARPDDRHNLADGDKILLIIEDDALFAKIIYDFSHKRNFKCLLAADGVSGLALVESHTPDAIMLDLHLPDISGWKVLELLKHNPATRHIPIQIMSADEQVTEAYRKGALGHLSKPISLEALTDSFQQIEHFIAQEVKSLLLVEDDPLSRQTIKKLLEGKDIQISEVEGGQAALEMLKSQHFDCMILDLSLPDMTGFEVLNLMNEEKSPVRCPVIVYTGRDLTPEENLELMKYADSVIVKGVRSPERLLDETALFLHRVVADLPADKQQTIKRLYNDDGLLKGKKILVVDDDMRNSFALSRLLSDKGITVRMAQNGQKALDLLAEDPVDLVLMDIMMPVMDGYEAIRRIRAQAKFRTLPILALTAKAMKGDQEKCLAAGANDYLAKPIDIDRLYSMLRVWLYQ